MYAFKKDPDREWPAPSVLPQTANVAVTNPRPAAMFSVAGTLDIGSPRRRWIHQDDISPFAGRLPLPAAPPSPLSSQEGRARPVPPASVTGGEGGLPLQEEVLQASSGPVLDSLGDRPGGSVGGLRAGGARINGRWVGGLWGTPSPHTPVACPRAVTNEE